MADEQAPRLQGRDAAALPGAGGSQGNTAAARLRAFRSVTAYLALVAGLLPLWPHSELLGAPLALVTVLAAWHELRRVPRLLLLMVACAGAVALLVAPQALLAAAASTAHLTSLVIAVMLLSATLGASSDLGAVSGSLFAGRPLARYLSFTFATGFLAIPLNFGAVGVMSTLISGEMQRGGDSGLTRNAARAVLRGFAFGSISSPLSISVVITLTFLSRLPAWELISVSLPFAIGYLMLGAVFRDRDDGRKPLTADRPPALMPWLRFAAYIGAICGSAFALSGLGGIAYSRAVALSCVAAVAIGLAFRRARGERAGLPSMSHIGNELAVMSGSAFLGVLASSAGLALMGMGFSLPAWTYPVVAFVVPWLLFAGGMLGLNPIVTGTMTGALLGPIWPPSALLGLGLGMVSGWGLTVAGTPYSANSLLLSRLTGYDAQHAALRWNLNLSLIALTSAGLLGAGLTYGLSAAA